MYYTVLTMLSSVNKCSCLPDAPMTAKIDTMNESHKSAPFKTLGTRLKYLREHSSESVAEVSGAVEINEDKLELIEQGYERPSEEILMLLITHYNMMDSDAVQLWELAGYDRRLTPDLLTGNHSDEAQSGKQMIMMLALDVRTQYTDGVDISINNAGAVLTFTQAGGSNQGQQPVAKVGMSLQQAEAVYKTLERALIEARYHTPRALPPPQSHLTDESSQPEKDNT